jgi:hypothetical protein
VIAAAVALAFAVPPASAIVGDQNVSSEFVSSAHGGYELTVGQINAHKVILRIHFDRRGRHRVHGQYHLCVWHGDSRHQCKGFRLRSVNGYPTDSVNFAFRFRHRHTGRYRVQWRMHKFGGSLSPQPLHFHYR